MFKYIFAFLLLATPCLADGLIITPSSVGVAPVGQIPGTATNDVAASGKVGEYLSANRASGAAISLASSPAIVDVVSVNLTAGDWDCLGNIVVSPAATTNILGLGGWISPISATFPTLPNNGSATLLQGNYTVGLNQAIQVGRYRVAISSPVTMYLSTQVVYNTSTASVYGFIGCRRMR